MRQACQLEATIGDDDVAGAVGAVAGWEGWSGACCMGWGWHLHGMTEQLQVRGRVLLEMRVY